MQFKTKNTSPLLVVSFVLFSEMVSAGPASDALGLYRADSEGKCEFSYVPILKMKKEDHKIDNICVPILVAIQSISNQNSLSMELVLLGVAEMNDDSSMKTMLRKEISRKQLSAANAYEVEVDTYDSGIFTLVDGSILRTTSSGYVGYIGYREDALLYRDGSKWKFCVSGSIYQVEILQDVRNEYSRRRISKSIYEIENLDICS